MYNSCFKLNLFLHFQYRKGGGAAWVYFIDQKIPVNAQSFIMRNLTADSTYSLKLAAKNELGMGEFATFHSEVKTLKVKENVAQSIVIWSYCYVVCFRWTQLIHPKLLSRESLGTQFPLAGTNLPSTKCPKYEITLPTTKSPGKPAVKR